MPDKLLDNPEMHEAIVCAVINFMEHLTSQELIVGDTEVARAVKVAIAFDQWAQHHGLAVNRQCNSTHWVELVNNMLGTMEVLPYGPPMNDDVLSHIVPEGLTEEQRGLFIEGIKAAERYHNV